MGWGINSRRQPVAAPLSNPYLPSLQMDGVEGLA